MLMAMHIGSAIAAKLVSSQYCTQA